MAVKTSGDCVFKVEVSHTENRTETEATSEGNCDGVRLQTDVVNPMTANELKDWPRTPDGNYDPTVRSEIRGHDAVHIEMWDNHLHFFYLFNGSNNVYAYSASSHYSTGTFWYLTFSAQSHYCQVYNSWGGCTRAFGFSSKWFHSNGFPFSWFPDVDAYSSAYAYAWASGSYACSSWHDWNGAGNYPNLHTHTSCYLT